MPDTYLNLRGGNLAYGDMWHKRFRTLQIRNEVKMTSLFQKFSMISGFSPLVKLHWEGSATNGATPSSLQRDTDLQSIASTATKTAADTMHAPHPLYLIVCYEVDYGQNQTSFYTNFNALFWRLTLGHTFCSFAFVLVYISLIQEWRVKGTLSKTRRGRPRWKQTLHRLPPPLCNFLKRKSKKIWHLTPDKWHRTPDIWHLTPDIWHMTHDTWHLTCHTWWGVNILSKVQLSSSHYLGVMMFWRFGGKGWLTQLIGKTALATPGLLQILVLWPPELEFCCLQKNKQK